MDRIWLENLRDKLIKQYGTTKGISLADKYSTAFHPSYQDDCTVDMALKDITYMEKLSPEEPLNIDFYLSDENKDFPLHLKLYQFNKPTPLSDTLPMLENMDLRALNEQPYQIILNSNLSIWISNFTVQYTHTATFDIEKISPILQDTFINTSLGFCENDGFNRLVLGAGLAWQEITILRAYAKYLRQTGFRFSQQYIEEALANTPSIASQLVALFIAKFDPKQKSSASKLVAEIESKILAGLETITSLDEDRIIRQLFHLAKATLRTNYFQSLENGKPKDYLSFKLSSKEIPDLPLPLPLYEIFVYSSRFEGIHLRNEKVSRGGIRWSDRREDFRTEVLGLMKAQKVKNAVIVPSGAKGGFVLKGLSPKADRDTIRTEVVNCYQAFIRGLLDLTDNFKDKSIVKPPQVICYDDDDPYLVVAADKGTATFSDMANRISKEYHFWLGDAFASGGSAGYDHKKIGITARGAWESIKRHFLELQIDPETTDFSVIGIGDMSGDVFGNGLIYSKHTKLIAAFDHRHIFLDPSPDPLISYNERVRLFNLPTSSWEDYNPKLISTGGGVFARTNKSIKLSDAIKKLLDVQEDSLTPNELIRIILKAPVDLLYNGGIGTYVKASSESHADVGDKTNEYCRINGNELRCRVVGEGGNLGFSQLGRVEYALTGGLINTDFIDNSAGVDCSDHEVNIKILLNEEMDKGKLTEEQRNQLLANMTNEVAELVLNDNYNQALTMSFSALHSIHYTTLYQNYLKDLEATGSINRQVEFLPDDKKISERKTTGQGLTRPELAVLLAYTKIHIKNEILKSDLPEDPYLNQIIETAFPALLKNSYWKQMQEHRLRREIVATQLSSRIVNEMGITFVYRMQTETGASIADIIRAHFIASSVFKTAELDKHVETLRFKTPIKMQYDLLHNTRRLLNLATRWFLRNKSLQKNMRALIDHFQQQVDKLTNIIPTLISGASKDYLQTFAKQLENTGLPEPIMLRMATCRPMYTALNVTETATQNHYDLLRTAAVYFAIGEYFGLVWFRDQIANDSRDGHWNTIARLTLRDELDTLQKKLTEVIMSCNKEQPDAHKLITQWMERNNQCVSRWKQILSLLNNSTNIDYTMFFISLRELTDLIRISEMV